MTTTRRLAAVNRLWPLVPMMAKLVPAVPADDEHWGYEIKWDGIRLLARIEHGAVQLMTRNLIDATNRYPELAALANALGGRSVVLDGELVGFDDSGRATFEALQGRMGLEGGKRVMSRVGVSVAYMIFDLLSLDDESQLGMPYEERRAALEALGWKDRTGTRR
ncbi:MAG: DNA ligase, partial [Chloroflexota bacterium]